MEWYYVKDGESRGPVNRDELTRLAGNGELRPEDLVWNSTMGEEWARADSVVGLFTGRQHELQLRAPGQDGRDLREPGAIKLIDPVKYAWRRMVLILFQPFEIGKWFALGFCAWLASLGESGGSFNTGSGGSGGGGGDSDFSVDGMLTGMEEAWAPVREFFQQYGGIVIGLVVVLVLIGLAAGIVFLWLRSRGKFMLLDNVLRNKAEVTEPWQTWKQHANSLFRWSLGYGIICLVITLGLLALAWPLVIKPCVEARAYVPEMAGGIAMIILLFLVFGTVTFYISRFLNDFIIPIMYRHDLTATEAWRKFLGLYHSNSGRFLTYGLFMLVLQMCAGMAILAAILVTCFIAGCLMGIPYLGAVLLLPVTVFFRLYGVEYLAQYGGDFVVGAAKGDDEPDA
ncbi:MAG: DUF4339 domain-containing protein [Kiritimatiellae bacterium]|nr:DUF4339 domain-containing protein [Kiritimatiellia bacterium]